MSRQDSKLQRWIERLLLATGKALVLVYTSARIQAVFMYHAGLRSFAALSETGRLQREMQASSGPRLQLTSGCGHQGESGHTRMPWQPNWVLNQQFKIPDGQKFNIDGQMTDAWGLSKGMKVSATKVTEMPETVVEQQKQVTGSMPPPPDSAPAEVASAELPHTGSQLPLIGILGFLALTAGLGLRAARLLV